MSPVITVDLAQTRKDAKRFERGYRQFERELVNLAICAHGAKTNERPLVSRNKREGWYLCKLKDQRINPKTLQFEAKKSRFIRTFDKDLALRYRKASGVQWMRIKPRTERQMAAVGTRMVEK